MWVEMSSWADSISGCETKYKGPRLVGYARQKTKACDLVRGNRWKPSFETTQEFPGSGDYVMIVEEVKSTIQAR